MGEGVRNYNFMNNMNMARINQSAGRDTVTDINRRRELMEETRAMAKDMLKFALKRIGTLNEDDLNADGYCGFDYLHDAVHTLRGRLPKGGPELKAMSKQWSNHD